ncbi:signal peptidase I [Spongorhabdus nitratireducens]
MDLNFPLILVLLVFGSGLIALFDRLVLLPRRQQAVANYRGQVGDKAEFDVIEKLEKENGIVETSRSVFPVLLLVLVLRSFLFEPFQIPSGSMIPTLQVGDFILVNKYAYGLRLPVVDTKVVEIGEPKRGDVMVFKVPAGPGIAKPGINYIKRVIGVPGDTIRYKDKRLYINGKMVPEKFVAQLTEERFVYRIYEETIDGETHQIRKDMMIFDPRAEGQWTVPEGHYFMMGDNRDRSNDSRYWGLVPEKNIVGKAVYIWMHWPSWTDIPNFRNNGAIQ